MERSTNKDVYKPGKNSNDAKLPETVDEIIEEKEELETPKLAKEIEKRGLFSESTARAKLYYAKKDIVNRTSVTTTRRKGDSAGNDTIIWKEGGRE